ncbi:MAG: hypothetical protein Q9172_004480 [Xanthocarpia lactea]
MKSFGLSYIAVLFVTFSSIKAIPTSDPSTPAPVNASQPTPQLATTADILNLASDLLGKSCLQLFITTSKTHSPAVQIVGTQSTPAEIAELCSEFDFSRLLASGYNVTTIENVFCQAASLATIPSLTEIQELTVEYSSWIWIYQAVGALNNDLDLLKQLCESINVASAFSVGQNGTLVKTTICNVANGLGLPEVPVPQFESEGSEGSEGLEGLDDGSTETTEDSSEETASTPSTPTPKGPKHHSFNNYPFHTAI